MLHCVDLPQPISAYHEVHIHKPFHRPHTRRKHVPSHQSSVTVSADGAHCVDLDQVSDDLSRLLDRDGDWNAGGSSEGFGSFWPDQHDFPGGFGGGFPGGFGGEPGGGGYQPPSGWPTDWTPPDGPSSPPDGPDTPCAPAPEPATYLMMGIGFCFLAGRLKRRKHEREAE